MAQNLDYIEEFRTFEFEYTSDSIVDMELQPFYDGSINIISVSEGTLPRIVNSRQRFFEDKVELVVRNDNNLDNVYDNLSIEKTLLVPKLGDMVPSLTFNGVRPENGKLMNGGYKYYFKLKTADGIESPLIEESRLVTIHSGHEFGKASSFIDNSSTRNAVQFTITNIDTKVYKYVSVYYTIAVGETGTTVKTAYHIDKDYDVVEGVAAIIHTGFEPESGIGMSEITAEYSPIASVAALTQKNNRLLLGNIVSENNTKDLLRTAALWCYTEEDPVYSFHVEQKMYNGNTSVDDSYADPNNVYHKLAYFPGETYEFAINFIFRSGAISEAFPTMGFDYTSDVAFDYSKLGEDIDWIFATVDDKGVPTSVGVQNSYGVVRMRNIDIEDTMHEIEADKNMAMMSVFTIAINTSNMVEQLAGPLYQAGVRSYFISRRKRSPDLLMEGLTTLAATAPLTSMFPRETSAHIFGMNLGYGLSKGSLSNSMVLFPTPGSAMPFSSEGVYMDGAEDKSTYYFDGILYAPLADANLNKYFAFYSPDITSDTATMAALSDKDTYSTYMSAILSQSLAYKEQKVVSTEIGNTPSKYAYSANPYRFIDDFSTGENRVLKKMQYVGDSMRAFSNMNFTGKLDRQASLYLYTHLVSYAKYGLVSKATHSCRAIWRDLQEDFSHNELSGNIGNNKDTHYCADLLLSQNASTCGNSLPLNAEQAYTQILMTGVNYSPYIGMELPTLVSMDLTNALTIPTSTGGQGYFTGYAELEHMMPADGITNMGATTKIYANDDGGPMYTSSWYQKYSIKRSGNYSAISKRWEISYPLDIATSLYSEPRLTGGDCYAGFYYQRAWRPGGIAGVPTATNPYNYIKDGDKEIREGVNITNSGYALGFPVRSKFNFALRAAYEADAVETKLYNKDRTYTSSFPEDEVHGNRQAETSVINYGNILDESIILTPPYDPNVPYIKSEYKNRVLTSEISVTGEFENGYRDFKGLNFKDYDEELGYIVATVSLGVYTYLIYKDGVSMIEISERTSITSEETGANVYMAAADVLPPKSIPILTNIGSQHLKSVISTEAGIFGVDADARKVWMLNMKEKAVISDATIQTLLNDLITIYLENIVSSYDVMSGEVTFTFIYKDAEEVETQKSILFSTRLKVWYGTTDIHKLYQFNIEDRMLSLQQPNESDVYSLYFPVVNNDSSDLFKNVGETTAIDDLDIDPKTKAIYKSYIEFVIKDENMSKFDLSNIIINGSGVPTSIEVMSESIIKYSIDSPSPGVSGIVQQTLPTHTNMYMQDALAVDLTRIDDYTFTRKRGANLRLLEKGDRITVKIGNSLQQLTIANTSYSDPTTDLDLIIVSQAMLPGTLEALYVGWKVPLRISLGETMTGKTKMTIPSKKIADLLRGGDLETAQNYHNNSSNAIPYGKWIKLRLYFEGIDQIYIESIISEKVLRYS